jgi:hypothetical protein
MQSSLIGKIEKAKRYAQEKDRVVFTDFKVSFRGDNDSYLLSYADGRWTCSCNFFSARGMCSHTMALQRILAEMLPGDAVSLSLAP